MLFYVKIQLLMDQMSELLKKSAEGIIPSPAQFSTIYCSAETPGLGYSIFDVESRETLDEILRELAPYSKVYEVAPVMTLAEFQHKMQG